MFFLCFFQGVVLTLSLFFVILIVNKCKQVVGRFFCFMETVRRCKSRVVYSDIENDLRKRILSGEFAEGSALPGEIPLSKHYAASRKTVRKALEQLRSQNFISKNQGVGNFVIPAAEREKMPRITAKIRLMMPENCMENEFCREVLAGVQKFTAGRGIAVTIGSHSESFNTLAEYHRTFQCDALLWCALPEKMPAAVAELAKKHIPQVVIDNYVEGAGAVFYDSLPAWRTLLLMLHNAGHREVAFLERAQLFSWSRKRQQAFMIAAGELNMHHHILNADWQDTAALKKFVTEHSSVTAYVVIPQWAEPFRALLYKLGKRVPHDLSYVEMTPAGISDDFQVTRIYIPTQGMGFAAAELLTEHDFRSDPEPVRAIGCFTVAGLSTGVKNTRVNVI